MIPVLYDHQDINQVHNKIGYLAETISCEVTEEKNGIYELTLKYPLNGKLINEIQEERQLVVKTSTGIAHQIFRIYRISKPMSGIITVYAQHISYDMSGVVVFPFSLTNVLPYQIFDHIKSHCLDRDIPFGLISDITTPMDFRVDTPRTLRNVLGGSEDSLLTVFGGEFEFNNETIKLNTNRGEDRGVSILYGKNLTALEHNSDLSGVYTHLAPYAKYKNSMDVEICMILPEKVLPIVTTLKEKKTLIMDFSSSFSDEFPATEANLRSVANDYLVNNILGIESPNITLSFEELSRQSEYSKLHEEVHLCDIVTVKYPGLSINIKTQIIKVVYDVLLEKIKSISLGKAQQTLTDKIISMSTKVDETTTKVEELPAIHQAIKNATDQITGTNGGNIVIRKRNLSNVPYELLVMDKQDIEEAQKVWRWNVNGLGYSSNGYNGPFTTAMTQDGAIVADFITAGTLNADVIKTGSITSSNGESYWNLESGDIKITGEINAPTGYISNFKINSDGISTGPTTVNDHTHNGLYLANGGINFNSGVTATGYTSILMKPFGTINNVGIGPHLMGQTYTKTNSYTINDNFILSNRVLSLKTYDSDDYLGGYVTYRTKIYSNDVLQDYVMSFVYPSVESEDEYVEQGKESGLASYTLSVGHVWDDYMGYVPDIFVEMVSYKASGSNNYGHLFGTWKSSSAIVVSSDRNKKKDIEVLDERYSTFFDHLNPVRFKYKNGTSSRFHTGLIAQEVIEALDKSNLSESELAAVCTIHGKDESTELGIRYEELIAICINEIQKLKTEIKSLKEEKK